VYVSGVLKTILISFIGPTDDKKIFFCSMN
jgi:hypothetical protein